MSGIYFLDAEQKEITMADDMKDDSMPMDDDDKKDGKGDEEGSEDSGM